MSRGGARVKPGVVIKLVGTADVFVEVWGNDVSKCMED